jgi:hypothetical protein
MGKNGKEECSRVNQPTREMCASIFPDFTNCNTAHSTAWMTPTSIVMAHTLYYYDRYAMPSPRVPQMTTGQSSTDLALASKQNNTYDGYHGRDNHHDDELRASTK